MNLTDREQQILLLSWFSNREVAQILGISHYRVRNIRSDIYAKLGIGGNSNKKIRALRAGLDAGIVSLSDLDPGVRRAS